MANDRSKIFFNVLALENILVALTREIGDGPCFLYIEFSWIGVGGERGQKLEKKLMTSFMNDPNVIKRQQPKFSNKMPGMGKYTELFYYYYHA